MSERDPRFTELDALIAMDPRPRRHVRDKTYATGLTVYVRRPKAVRLAEHAAKIRAGYWQNIPQLKHIKP